MLNALIDIINRYLVMLGSKDHWSWEIKAKDTRWKEPTISWQITKRKEQKKWKNSNLCCASLFHQKFKFTHGECYGKGFQPRRSFAARTLSQIKQIRCAFSAKNLEKQLGTYFLNMTLHISFGCIAWSCLISKLPYPPIRRVIYSSLVVYSKEK